MILTTYDSVNTAYTKLQYMQELNWNELISVLEQWHDVANKEDARLFNLWLFDPDGEPGRKNHYVNGVKDGTFTAIPNTIRRCKNNAVGLSGIILDIDDKLSIEDVLTAYAGLEYFLYTTFNHTINKHKFRVVLPFTRMMLKAEFELKKDSISETFNNVDSASFSSTQAFYFHSGHADAITYHNSGVTLTPDCFKDKVVKRIIRPTAKTEMPDSWKTDVIKGLVDSKNGVTRDKRLVMVTCMKVAGFSFSDTEYVDRSTCLSDTNTDTKYLWDHCDTGLFDVSKAQSILTRSAKIKEHFTVTRSRILEKYLHNK